jgi:hypothetical protein
MALAIPVAEAAVLAAPAVEAAAMVGASAVALTASKIPEYIGKHGDEIITYLSENLDKLQAIIGHVVTFKDNVSSIVKTAKDAKDQNDKMANQLKGVTPPQQASASGSKTESVEELLRMVYSSAISNNQDHLCALLDNVVSAFKENKKMQSIKKVTPDNLNQVMTDITKELTDMIERLKTVNPDIVLFCTQFDKSLTKFLGITFSDRSLKLIDRLRIFTAYITQSALHSLSPSMGLWLKIVERYKGIVVVIESLKRLRDSEVVVKMHDKSSKVACQGYIDAIVSVLTVINNGLYTSFTHGLDAANKAAMSALLSSTQDDTQLFGGAFPTQKRALLFSLARIKDVSTFSNFIISASNELGFKKSELMGAIDNGKSGLRELYSLISPSKITTVAQNSELLDLIDEIMTILVNDPEFKDLVKDKLGIKIKTSASGVRYVDDNNVVVNPTDSQNKTLLTVLLNPVLRFLKARNKYYSIFTMNIPELSKEVSDFRTATELTKIIESFPEFETDLDIFVMMGFHQNRHGLELFDNLKKWVDQVNSVVNRNQTRINAKADTVSFLHSFLESLKTVAEEILGIVETTRNSSLKLSKAVISSGFGENPNKNGDSLLQIIGLQDLSDDDLSKINSSNFCITTAFGLDTSTNAIPQNEIAQLIVFGNAHKSTQRTFASGKSNTNTAHDNLVKEILEKSSQLKYVLYTKDSAKSSIKRLTDGITLKKGVDRIASLDEGDIEKIKETHKKMFEDLTSKFIIVHDAYVAAASVFSANPAEQGLVAAKMVEKRKNIIKLIQKINAVVNGIIHIELALKNAPVADIQTNKDKWKGVFLNLMSSDFTSVLNGKTLITEMMKLYSVFGKIEFESYAICHWV